MVPLSHDLWCHNIRTVLLPTMDKYKSQLKSHDFVDCWMPSTKSCDQSLFEYKYPVSWHSKTPNLQCTLSLLLRLTTVFDHPRLFQKGFGGYGWRVPDHWSDHIPLPAGTVSRSLKGPWRCWLWVILLYISARWVCFIVTWCSIVFSWWLYSRLRSLRNDNVCAVNQWCQYICSWSLIVLSQVPYCLCAMTPMCMWLCWVTTAHVQGIKRAPLLGKSLAFLSSSLCLKLPRNQPTKLSCQLASRVQPRRSYPWYHLAAQ